MSDQRQVQEDGKMKGAARRYFRRLRDDAPVEYCSEACLPAQSRYSNCRLCESACPAAALTLGEGGVDVSASCVGCGQCATVCPTGALGIPGFAWPELAPQALLQQTPVFVDCWKVAAADSPRSAIRVPCLGGISVSRMIELRVAAGTRPIVLLDRGWCAGCAAGASDNHPAQRSLQAAIELLQAVAIPAGQWPVIASRPLPVSQQVSEKSDRSKEQRLSRRAFFGDLAARTTNTACEINPLTSGKKAPVARGFERRPQRSRERERLLAQLDVLTKRSGASMPAALYPDVHIDTKRCAHHQLCTTTCPTGALVSVKRSGVTGVVFDSEACIACGQCEAICAEGALHMGIAGEGAYAPGPRVIARVRQRACSGCGRPFEVTGQEALCPACSKRSGLARTAFETLFGRAN